MPSASLEVSPRIYRKTNNHVGWRDVFSPADGSLRFLTYSRLVLNSSIQEHTMVTGQNEWIVFCIAGNTEVHAGGEKWMLGPRDTLFLPRNLTVELCGCLEADLALASCPTDVDSKPQIVRFSDVHNNPEFFFDAGTREKNTLRRIHHLVGKNIQATRLLAGITIGEPTAWTSWPPHEHANTKEEFYLFFDMPPPAASVQLVYNDTATINFREVVHEGDCVTIPSGYHPTAAMPDTRSCFLWVMAAINPITDRDFKVGINIHPDYTNVKFI